MNLALTHSLENLAVIQLWESVPVRVTDMHDHTQTFYIGLGDQNPSHHALASQILSAKPCLSLILVKVSHFIHSCPRDVFCFFSTGWLAAHTVLCKSQSTSRHREIGSCSKVNHYKNIGNQKGFDITVHGYPSHRTLIALADQFPLVVFLS